MNSNDDCSDETEIFDAIVVGGGPGGSTTASLIARDGNRVLLLEAETFPRYQIGESLLPSTIHGVCALLGVDDQLREAGFPVKRGGTFKWGANPEPWTFAFETSRNLPGPVSHAYQVERMKFDKILLDNAEKLGVDVRYNHSATGVVRDDDGRIAGVTYRDTTQQTRTATARFVVDASGSGSRLHNEVGGRREYSPFFRNLALFGYFEGAKRLPAPNSGNILCVAFDAGWFWFIPLSDTLTSVGVVVKHEMAAEIQGDPAEALEKLIAKCPLISDHLDGARRVEEGPYGQLRVRKDYSYDRTSIWAPGMCLVGDAAVFIDPVFSSGVHLSTYSGMLAARTINSVLAGDIAEEAGWQEFEFRYRHEFALFRDFVTAFYEMHVDEDSYFWQARKIAGQPGDAKAAFAELVGGVAGLDFARPDLDSPEGNTTDLVRAAAALTSVTTNSDEDGTCPVPEDTSPVVIGALSAMVPHSAKHDAAFTDRLAVSPDGLRWC